MSLEEIVTCLQFTLKTCWQLAILIKMVIIFPSTICTILKHNLMSIHWDIFLQSLCSHCKKTVCVEQMGLQIDPSDQILTKSVRQRRFLTRASLAVHLNK